MAFLIFVTGCAISKMTNNNADQANHKDSNKEKEKKHDSGEIFFSYFVLTEKNCVDSWVTKFLQNIS